MHAWISFILQEGVVVFNDITYGRERGCVWLYSPSKGPCWSSWRRSLSFLSCIDSISNLINIRLQHKSRPRNYLRQNRMTLWKIKYLPSTSSTRSIPNPIHTHSETIDPNSPQTPAVRLTRGEPKKVMGQGCGYLYQVQYPKFTFAFLHHKNKIQRRIMTINNPYVVAAEHFTALEEVAWSCGAFTYEGEDLGDEELLEVWRGGGGVEFC